MLRSLLLSVCLALVATVQGEVLVADNFGNSVSLPFHGGEVLNTLTMDAGSEISPYVIQVFVNDGGHIGERESFYFESSTYGDATLISQTHSATFAQSNAVSGNFVGSKDQPTASTGLYTFTFDIPAGQHLNLDLVYLDANPKAPLTDHIHFGVTNKQ